ncbi:MAG TPA: hypothetical protein VIP05_32040, partial [Burkholderiaceae bacterium]
MNTEHADIHCPKCEWKPHHEDRWSCVPSCGTAWNTFWTRGVCPGCGVEWPITQCPGCEQHSPHESWYHSKQPGGDVTHEIVV